MQDFSRRRWIAITFREIPPVVELNRRESNKSNNFNVQARHSSISRERDVNKKKNLIRQTRAVRCK